MAWISMDFQSTTLKRPVELEVLLPESGKADRVLFLLHGRRENRMGWLLKSQIECFATEQNICVVMPDGMNSFYVNTHNAYAFMDYICKELPQLIKSTYHVPQNPALWMIAGCDIGGYGALRCGLEHSDIFGYIASFSGILDIVKHYDACDFVNMWNVFGEKENLMNSDHNLCHLLNKWKTENCCRIMLTCGQKNKMLDKKEDIVFEDNKNFYRYALSLVTTGQSNPKHANIFLLTKESDCNWSLWNDSLKAAIDWFCGNHNYKEGFTCQ